MTDDSRKQNELENLVVGHFDGSLTEKQEKELAEALAATAEAKQFFLSYMRMEGRLHSLGRDGFLREPVAETAIESERPAPRSTAVGPVVRSGRQRWRLLAASTSLAVCVLVILMLSSGVLWNSPVSASGVLQKAQQAAAESIDRTYHVTISHARERSQTQELTINVRGGGRFVMQPADGAYVMGNDGTDFWVTQKSGPVWVTSDFWSLAPKLRRRLPNRGLLELAASPNEPLLVGMADLLSLIERKFEVELVESETVKEHHIRATVNSVGRNDPEVIEVWADVVSGVALRAEVRWSNGRQTRFEIAETSMLSDRWYHHSEHAPGRKVQRLDASTSL